MLRFEDNSLSVRYIRQNDRSLQYKRFEIINLNMLLF